MAKKKMSKTKGESKMKQQESKYLGHQHHLEGDDFSVSQMRGKTFEVDKDVEKSKRMNPKDIFQNYNSKNKKGTKRKKKKMDKPQPIAADKKSNSYKI